MPISLKKRFSAAWRAFIDGQVPSTPRQSIPAISAEEVAEVKAFFPREKFFVFGHARSGTTLLVRLVRLHPEVHCNYQAHFFTRPPLLTRAPSRPRRSSPGRGIRSSRGP